MGTVTADEVNFQRLLDRSERLCAESLSFNLLKLGANLKELEELYGRLQRNRNIDNDVLQQYERDLQSLRIQIETEQKKTIAPFSFDGQEEVPNPAAVNTEDYSLDDIVLLKARNKAAYNADLRRQLFGGSERTSSSAPSLEVMNTEQIARREAEKQENLANELFDMARLMKQTYTTAGAVIKEDNATLSRLQQTADSHKGSLLKESKRLEEHAYRSWCDFLYILGVCAIIVSFISMVLVMRVFTKKY